MAIAPERSRPLHNFTLPRLKWGNQRLLRCMRFNGDGGEGSNNRRSESESETLNRNRFRNELIKRRSSNATESFKKSPLKPIIGGNSDGDDGIEAVREKLMCDLRLAADKMKVSILEEKEYEKSNPAARPWNLRTRRAACKEPNLNQSGGSCVGGGGTKRPNSSPESPTVAAKTSRLRGLVEAATTTTIVTQSEEEIEKKKRERANFSISISRKEVESDFLAMTGIKPPRRPKKRPKIVQKQLNSVFPGLWLTEITPETYKIPDVVQ